MARLKFRFSQGEGRDTAERQLAREFGVAGEQMAAAYLEERGYTILERNDRLHHWEVDIIALKDGVLHFVEVKSRMSESMRRAEAAVDRGKARRLVAVANKYIQSHGRTEPAQIDVIAVVRQGDTYSIRHTERAVDPLTLSLTRLDLFV